MTKKTDAERAAALEEAIRTLIRNAGNHINRVRMEAHQPHPHYDVAADDVCNKLCFDIDYARGVLRLYGGRDAA